MRDDTSRREFVKRLGMVLGGLAIALVGVPLLILPGSGLVLIIGGLALAGKGIGLDVKSLARKCLKRLSGEDARDSRESSHLVEKDDQPPTSSRKAHVNESASKKGER